MADLILNQEFGTNFYRILIENFGKFVRCEISLIELWKLVTKSTTFPKLILVGRRAKSEERVTLTIIDFCQYSDPID